MHLASSPSFCIDADAQNFPFRADGMVTFGRAIRLGQMATFTNDFEELVGRKPLSMKEIFEHMDEHLIGSHTSTDDEPESMLEWSPFCQPAEGLISCLCPKRICAARLPPIEKTAELHPAHIERGPRRMRAMGKFLRDSFIFDEPVLELSQFFGTRVSPMPLPETIAHGELAYRSMTAEPHILNLSGPYGSFTNPHPSALCL